MAIAPYSYAYEKLLEQDDNDAEAHWGAVISRFGIDYSLRNSNVSRLQEVLILIVDDIA